MVHTALLRGINVGGNNPVDMRRLQETFLRAGVTDVRTYINSGNVVFRDARLDGEALETLLEDAIRADFGLDLRILTFSLEEFAQLMSSVPETWHNDDRAKCDVLFLPRGADVRDLAGRLTIRPDVDEALFTPRAVLWRVARENVTRSGLLKIIGTPLYKNLTVRNINTTRKLYAIMREIDGTGGPEWISER